LGIKRSSKPDEICISDCWEQHLCTEYRWGCNAPGKKFGKRAYQGQKAFFVFQQPDKNKYTLWGRTLVNKVDDTPMVGDKEGEAGYAFIHFDPFIPLPIEKWIPNLSDLQLVGKVWLMGTYRYIDNIRETYLENLIEGLIPEQQMASKDITPSANDRTLYHFGLAPNILDKLDAIATDEGRSKDDLVREAIAEWLKSRK
jgi:hypothetical protein